MKIYKWHGTISTQNDVCSQHRVPPKAKSTITLGQHNPKKLTRKKQDQNHRHTQRYIHITRYVRTMLLKHRGMIIMIGLIFFIIQLVWK